MAKVKLINVDDYAIVDDEDYEKIRDHEWTYSSNIGFVNANHRKNNSANKILMHLLILGEHPKKSGYETVIRHRNGNKLDNRKNNLEHVSVSLRNHTRNRIYENKTSRFKGVCWVTEKKTWRAAASIKGKHKHLGYFKNEVDAAIAYDNFCKSYYGDQAQTNDV